VELLLKEKIAVFQSLNLSRMGAFLSIIRGWNSSGKGKAESATNLAFFVLFRQAELLPCPSGIQVLASNAEAKRTQEQNAKNQIPRAKKHG
jgi:hypothetical protein